MTDGLRKPVKRRVGRPATGQNPVVALTIPKPLLAKIDHIAADKFEPRRHTIRRLLWAGALLELGRGRD